MEDIEALQYELEQMIKRLATFDTEDYLMLENEYGWSTLTPLADGTWLVIKLQKVKELDFGQ